MNAKQCYQCEFYLLTRNSQTGLCDRVRDPGAVFYVSPKQNNCIYDSQGKKLSNSKIEERDKKANEDFKRFDKHLEDAARIVNSWPEWKRMVIGGY